MTRDRRVRVASLVWNDFVPLHVVKIAYCWHKLTIHCCVEYILGTRSANSYLSTERIDRAQGEALAEECRDAVHAFDDATLMNLWGMTFAGIIGS